MTSRENFMRAVRFEFPEHVPMTFHINAACWQHYPQAALQDLMASHPLLFPDFTPQPLPVEPQFACNARADRPYTDLWGCRWETTDDGIVGTVTNHPLADWSAFDSYEPPDLQLDNPLQPRPPARSAADTAGERLRGGGLRHGHTFLQLCDLRGYQNLLFDMIDGEPRLWRLIEMVEDYNMHFVKLSVAAEVDFMQYPEDLGMQHGPMLSPDQFREFILPSYRRLVKPAREAGIPVHMHSDGDIRELIDDIIGGGVEIVNLQDLVNGIDWIRDRLAGRVCIDLDIDRQSITRSGSAAEIDGLIREEVTKLGSREGGLMMIYGLYPGVSLDRVACLMDSMERYAGHFSG